MCKLTLVLVTILVLVGCYWPKGYEEGAVNITFDISYPAWVPVETYVKGRVVYWKELNYRGLQDANLGNPPDVSPLWWELLSE